MKTGYIVVDSVGVTLATPHLYYGRMGQSYDSPNMLIGARQSVYSGEWTDLVPLLFKEHPDMRIIYCAIEGNLEEARYPKGILGDTVKTLYEVSQNEIFEAAVRFRPDLIGLIPYQKQTKQLALLALNGAGIRGGILPLISPSLKDSDVYAVAVRNCWKALKDVPDSEVTYSMCVDAVTQNGLAYEYVPERFRTYWIKLQSVTSNGEALKFMPHQNESLIEAGLMNTGKAFPYVERDLLTPRILLEFVRHRYGNLAYVPNIMRSADLCDAYIEEYPCGIVDVPECFVTQSMCNKVFKRCKRAFAYFPEKFQTKEMRLEVARAGLLDLIKDPTDEEIDLGIEAGADYGCFPSDRLTYDRCLKIVRNCGADLDDTPIEYVTNSLIMVALNSDPTALKFVPNQEKWHITHAINHARNEEEIVDIMENCIFDEKLLDAEIYALAVKKGYPLERVPEGFMDEIIKLI